MIIFDARALNNYKQKDIIFKYLQKISKPVDKKFTSHQWLLESLPKRMVFDYMYSDLLIGKTISKKILDIGGGYTGLTRLFLEKNDYFTLDIMAHDDHNLFKSLQRSIGKEFWINSDWFQYSPDNHYDIVIANDLFPNVDQRLDLFINKYLPLCDEMRISLTYYNDNRWYRVKRVDADEIFHMMAWDGEQIKTILEKYITVLQYPDLNILKKEMPSLFPNNRQVCMLVFEGENTL